MEQSIEEILLEEGVVTREQLSIAKKYKEESGDRIEEILVLLKFIEESTFLKILEKYTKMDIVDLKETGATEEAIKLISKEMAYHNCLIPFAIKNNKLCIAVSDPFDRKSIEGVRFITKKDTELYIADRKQIISAIEQYYDGELIEKAVEDLKKNLKEEEKNLKGKEIKDLESAPAVKFINYILSRAIDAKASDIHIEPFEKLVVIRFRIDGKLTEIKRMPKTIYSSICTRIKIMSGMDISEKRIPQDGKINSNAEESGFDFRVSSLPTIFGEKFVIRILYRAMGVMNLRALGFDTVKDERIKELLQYPYGLILITGPTGSGKSTTIYSMLSEIEGKDKNIVTIEEPVEHTIFGINQVSINAKSDITFSGILRNIVRQDPDIIVVGEIRDEETAKMAIQSACTGHLVFSTLHTNDALSTINRLVDMKIPQYLVADALTAVIAQRLVRKICPYCKEEYEPNFEQKNILCFSKENKLYKGAGCSKCNFTGYKGRSVVYEWVVLDRVHKSIIERKGSTEELRIHSRKMGMVSLAENCKSLLESGITSFEEFLRVKHTL